MLSCLCMLPQYRCYPGFPLHLCYPGFPVYLFFSSKAFSSQLRQSVFCYDQNQICRSRNGYSFLPFPAHSTLFPKYFTHMQGTVNLVVQLDIRYNNNSPSLQQNVAGSHLRTASHVQGPISVLYSCHNKHPTLNGTAGDK
jgi:hypothetical protein